METGRAPVCCRGCGRTWHSVSMVNGLRLLRSCPRCGGELEFRDPAPGEPAAGGRPSGASAEVAPHLVLGLPRLDA